MSALPGAPRLVRPLLAAFLAVAVVDLAGLLAGAHAAHLAAKPLLLPLLAAYAAARGDPGCSSPRCCAAGAGTCC